MVNEAMACGLPIGVAETVGAAYDLVQDDVNGYKFDPADVVSMENALCLSGLTAIARYAHGAE